MASSARRRRARSSRHESEDRLRADGPGRLAAPDRVDHIEVVGLDDFEVVLFWDVHARDTGRMEAALRADLERLEADEFLARWAAVDSADEV